MGHPLYPREVHEISISARIVEGVDDDGEYFPESVAVTGAEFLQASAVTDIAQETVNSYFGSYDHRYLAIRPDDITGDTTVVVIEQRS